MANRIEFGIRPAGPGDHPALLGLSTRLTVGVAPWRDPAKAATAVRGWITSSLASARQDGHDVLVALPVTHIRGLPARTHLCQARPDLPRSAGTPALWLDLGRDRGVPQAGRLLALTSSACVLVACSATSTAPGVPGPPPGASPERVARIYLGAAAAGNCKLTAALTLAHTWNWCEDPRLLNYQAVRKPGHVPASEACGVFPLFWTPDLGCQLTELPIS